MGKVKVVHFAQIFSIFRLNRTREEELICLTWKSLSVNETTGPNLWKGLEKLIAQFYEQSVDS